jgi:hypothetical protein
VTVLATTLADAVWALLTPLGNLGAVTGAIPFRGDLVDANGNPVEPPLDPDGRVHPYFVAYFGGGRASSLRVAGSRDKVAWSCQVSCVGGDDNRALWCVDQVRAALTGKRVAGGCLYETVEPGPPQRSDNVRPPRFWTPILYGLNVTG